MLKIPTAFSKIRVYRNFVSSNCICELGNSVSIVSGYGLDDQAIKVRSLTEAKVFFACSFCVQTGLGPTQPPIQWVPGVLCQGIKGSRGVTLTAHLI
jgi:hypothetical protein